MIQIGTSKNGEQIFKAMGWNEHGNLGVGDEDNRSEFTTVAVPSEPGRKYKVAVGGAFVIFY